jgi:hypothetical protein
MKSAQAELVIYSKYQTFQISNYLLIWFLAISMSMDPIRKGCFLYVVNFNLISCPVIEIFFYQLHIMRDNYCG